MNVSFDEFHNSYGIFNMSYEEFSVLKDIIESCNLPEKRTFYNLQNEIHKVIATHTVNCLQKKKT